MSRGRVIDNGLFAKEACCARRILGDGEWGEECWEWGSVAGGEAAGVRVVQYSTALSYLGLLATHEMNRWRAGLYATEEELETVLGLHGTSSGGTPAYVFVWCLWMPCQVF